jgi:ribosomal protein S18 acetylase RimI-like enzyme
MIDISEISIHEIISDNFKLLVQFLQKNDIEEIKRQFNPFPLTRDIAFHIAYENHMNKYYSVVFNEKIIGLGMLRGWDEGFLVPSIGLLIDKDFQGMGLGKLLLEYLLNEAKKLHCHRVRLTVYVSNQAAVNLYKSVGFQELSRTPIYIMKELDEKILMCKEL